MELNTKESLHLQKLGKETTYPFNHAIFSQNQESGKEGFVFFPCTSISCSACPVICSEPSPPYLLLLRPCCRSCLFIRKHSESFLINSIHLRKGSRRRLKVEYFLIQVDLQINTCIEGEMAIFVFHMLYFSVQYLFLDHNVMFIMHPSRMPR